MWNEAELFKWHGLGLVCMGRNDSPPCQSSAAVRYLGEYLYCCECQFAPKSISDIPLQEW